MPCIKLSDPTFLKSHMVYSYLRTGLHLICFIEIAALMTTSSMCAVGINTIFKIVLLQFLFQRY